MTRNPFLVEILSKNVPFVDLELKWRYKQVNQSRTSSGWLCFREMCAVLNRVRSVSNDRVS